MDEIGAVRSISGSQQLSPDERAELAKLAARDREVRMHEAAHLATAGSFANGVEYEYEMGPDGKLYAVGGKVKISVPKGGSPEERLARARQLRAAASAPAEPSAQDMSVMAKASAMEAEALEDIAKERSESSDSSPAAFGRFDRLA